MTPEERAAVVAESLSCIHQKDRLGQERTLAAAIREAVADEREACAKVVEDWHNDSAHSHDSWEWCSCEDTAAAIRSRSKNAQPEVKS